MATSLRGSPGAREKLGFWSTVERRGPGGFRRLEKCWAAASACPRAAQKLLLFPQPGAIPELAERLGWNLSASSSPARCRLAALCLAGTSSMVRWHRQTPQPGLAQQPPSECQQLRVSRTAMLPAANLDKGPAPRLQPALPARRYGCEPRRHAASPFGALTRRKTTTMRPRCRPRCVAASQIHPSSVASATRVASATSSARAWKRASSRPAARVHAVPYVWPCVGEWI